MFDGLDAGMHGLFVAPGDLVRWADHIRPHIEKMAEGSSGRYEWTDIFAALAAGRMQLWIALDGSEIACVLITEIVNYPRLRAMRCIGVSGHRPRRWMQMLKLVEDAAREKFGCAVFEALHQLGHERLLRTGGWHAHHLLSEKRL